MTYSNRAGVNIFITEETNGGNLVFPIASKPLEKVSLTLMDFRFHNLLNNVTKRNNKIKISHTIAGILDITIPIGHYTATSLRDKLNQLLNPYIVVTYGDYQWSFVSTHSFTVTSDSTCRKLLGLGDTFPLNSGLYPAHTLIMPKRANMIASDNITIHIPQLHVNVISPLSPPDTIYARVPVNCPYGETIFYRPSIPYKFLLRRHNLSVLTIILRDDLGNLLSDPFSCNLGVEYVYVSPDQEINNDTIIDDLPFTHMEGNIPIKPFQGSGGFKVG